MIFEHNNYRAYLKSTLVERISKNPAYSLRAFAKTLGIQPSQLSEIYSGKKNLSLQAALKTAKKLGLNQKETDYLCTLVQYEATKSEELKSSLNERLKQLNEKYELRDLSIDVFKAISDWYHIPILEMSTLHCTLSDLQGANPPGFQFTPDKIAKRLGITVHEASAAIERLERLELLEKDKKRGYRKVHSNALFKSNKPNTALRLFHKQMLEKAIESLESQTPQEKYIGSQTFSIDLTQLEQAKTLADEFRKKLVLLFSKGKTKTETYHLGIQLFRLTTHKEKSK